MRPTGRRAEILGIAARVIARNGLAGATVRDIGKEAGILSGSLYHHFESKDQMVLEILHPLASAQLDHHRAVIAEGRRTAEPVPDTIRRLITLTLRDAAAHPAEARIHRNDNHLFQLIPALAPLVELGEEAVRIWTELVQAGAERGELALPLPPRAAVLLLFDAVLCSIRWIDCPSPLDPDVVSAQLSACFLDGLRARPPEPGPHPYPAAPIPDPAAD